MVYMRGALPTTLQAIMGSRIRAGVIARVFNDELGRPWLRDVYRSVKSASGVRRELDRLSGMGLIRSRREGGAVFFEVVETHALARPLRELARASGQMDELLRDFAIRETGCAGTQVEPAPALGPAPPPGAAKGRRPVL
jgi:DNA-binding transcriptional ArsR family regulator